jgi:hypothetical protein
MHVRMGVFLLELKNQSSSDKSPRARVAEALDHSYHLGSLSASVNLFQEIPSRLEQSWVQGQIKVTLNDSVFNGSHGMKHYAELALQILQRAARRHGKIMFENLRQFMEMKEEDKNELLAFVPVVVFIRHDGGHDHKNTLLQNIAALVAFVELLQLHALVNNRNAPDGSWINSVECCLNILNLGLDHQSYARDECNTQEYLVKSCSSMKALRDLGDRDEMVKEEWSESISGIIDDIGSRMSQLLLKDEPVTVAPSAIEDDVMVLKEVLQNACDDYSDKYRARDDLRQMPKLERRLNQDGGFQSTYLSEVRGTCTRGPLWLKKLFTYPVPHAMKRAPKDEHFLSYDDLAMKQAFGFITTERYLPSH